MKDHIFIPFVVIFSLFSGIATWRSNVTHKENLNVFDRKVASFLSDTTLLNEPTSIQTISTASLNVPTQAPVPVPSATPANSNAAPSSQATPIVSVNSNTSPESAPAKPADAPAVNSSPSATPSLIPATDIPSTSVPVAITPTSSSDSVQVVTTPAAPLSPIDKWLLIQKQLGDFLGQDSGTDWNITVHDLATNTDTISIGNQNSFTAASTTKLITAEALLNEVQKNTVSLDQQVGAFPLDFQLDELITQSNNDSWGLINDLLGSDKVEKYAHEIGVSSYKFSDNTVNPHEMSAMLTSLYQEKLLNTQNTQRLLGYMQNTEEERFLPPAIPSGSKVYHKVGLLDDLVHDVGIVETGGHNYSVAIYSNGHGVQEYDQRALKFAQIGSILFKNSAQ